MHKPQVFAHPNPVNFLCPICSTSADRPVVLLPIPGTEYEETVECRQVHDECLRLVAEMQRTPPVTTCPNPTTPGEPL